jgi:tetratricopeptide (TPR) repeat protein
MIQKKQYMEWSNSTQAKFITLLVLLTITSAVFSESPYKKSIYSAFITHDMAKWENVIHTIESSNATTTVDQKLELINYYYGYIGWLIGQKQFAKAEKFIPKGEKLIQQVLKVSPNNATAYSFKGSYLGFKIGIDKCKAIFLGSDSKRSINKALELDPQNLQAIIDKGNLLYYSPRFFGGDKKEALNYFLRGARIMEKNKDVNQNWVYLNLLTIIASAYEMTDKLEDAKLVYEKIIKEEPDIKWVKYDLYPSLLAKMKV